MLHWRIHRGQNLCFKSSHLRYAVHPYIQYQITVKLLGSFRLVAGRRHLHRPCIFTKQILETVLQSLYHSCTSELHEFDASYPCDKTLSPHFCYKLLTTSYKLFKDSAPPKLSIRYCLSTVLPPRLENTETKSGISLATP